MFSENANRFISAYNQIDQCIRTQYDLSKSISYTEAIRKCARMNALVSFFAAFFVIVSRLARSAANAS